MVIWPLQVSIFPVKKKYFFYWFYNGWLTSYFLFGSRIDSENFFFFLPMTIKLCKTFRFQKIRKKLRSSISLELGFFYRVNKNRITDGSLQLFWSKTCCPQWPTAYLSGIHGFLCFATVAATCMSFSTIYNSPHNVLMAHIFMSWHE